MIVYTLVCMFDTTQHSAQHTPPHTTHHTAHITHHPSHNTQHCIQHDIQHNSATAQHHTPHNTPDEVLSLLPTLITGSGICAARPPIGKFCDKSEGEGEEGGRGVEESEKGKAGRTGGTGMGRRAGRGRREKGVSGGTEQREDLARDHTHTQHSTTQHTHTHPRQGRPSRHSSSSHLQATLRLRPPEHITVDVNGPERVRLGSRRHTAPLTGSDACTTRDAAPSIPRRSGGGVRPMKRPRVLGNGACRKRCTRRAPERGRAREEHCFEANDARG